MEHKFLHQIIVPLFAAKMCTSILCILDFYGSIITKAKAAGGISETKSKQQSPCSDCMHQPVMSWPLLHHGPITWLLHALTAWDLKFQVCLRYTFTPATLYKSISYIFQTQVKKRNKCS
jgi:hypothetical protein